MRIMLMLLLIGFNLLCHASCRTTDVSGSLTKDVVGFDTAANRIFTACLRDGKIKAYECAPTQGDLGTLKCGLAECSTPVGDADGISLQEYLEWYPNPSGNYPKTSDGLRKIEMAIQYEKARSAPRADELIRLGQLESDLRVYLSAESKLQQGNVEASPDYEQLVFVAVKMLLDRQAARLQRERNEKELAKIMAELEAFRNQRRSDCHKAFTNCEGICQIKHASYEYQYDDCINGCVADREKCLSLIR